MERLLLKPEEAATALGLGRATTYALLATGTLPSVRVGRAVRVPAEALRQWVADATSGPSREDDDSLTER
jgi:excisionase family DNA binding protein